MIEKKYFFIQRSFNENLIALSVLFAIATILYGHTLEFQYFLDDILQVVNNPSVYHLDNILNNFLGSTVVENGASGGIYFKPIMMMIYNLSWHIGNGNSFAFHIIQLIFHTLNAFLIFIIFNKCTSKKNIFLNFCLASVYLIHPLNTEAVTYIADLQEPLFVFFGLIAIITAFEWKAYSLIIIAISLLLSLLSKESGIFFFTPILLLVYFRSKNKTLSVLLAMLAVLVIYFTMRFQIAELTTLHSQNMLIGRVDFFIRAMTMPRVLLHYPSQFIYPDNLSLTQDWVVREMSLDQFWIPLFIITSLSVAMIWYLVVTRSKNFVFFFIWFFVGWIAHSQIIPLDGTVADRWFYFTMIGLLGMITSVFSERIHFSRKYVLIFFTIILYVFGKISFERSKLWESEVDLYFNDLKSNLYSFYINNNIGLYYIDHKKYDEAIKHFEVALNQVSPNSADWFAIKRNIAFAYLMLGVETKKLLYFKEAENLFIATLADNDVRSYRGYAATLQGQMRYKELRLFLNEALKKFSHDEPLLKTKKDIESIK